MCEQAVRILEHGGVSSAVNAIPAKITPWFKGLEIDGVMHFARLAQYEKDEQQPLPFVVLARDQEVPVTTPSPSLLTFRDGLGHISLIVSNSLNPLVDDERYVSLVANIISDISEQYQEDVLNRESVTTQARRRFRAATQAVKEYFNDGEYSEFFGDRGDRRTFVALAMSVTALLGYGHLPFTGADAKIGPIPMPQPIEFLVDWNNAPDHKAQSFDEPTDAV